MGETFRPFENFERSLESSLASRPKFSKEAKASTASRRLDERSEVPNTRIFSNANGGESQGDSADSMESNAESSENNFVFARALPLSKLKDSIKSKDYRI